MAQPPLRAYLQSRRFSDTNIYFVGFDGTIGIGDQIRKAVALVKLGQRFKLFETSNRVLVLGAGAAGVAAGLTATTLGFDGQILERSDLILSTLRPATTRYLHPNEYNWPLPCTSSPFFPNTPKKAARIHSALRWCAARAHKVAEEFDKKFFRLRTRPKFHNNVEIKIAEKPIDAILELDPKGKFAMVIVAAGATEICTVKSGEFTSSKYWSEDKLSKPLCGRDREKGENTKILVSGRGDGALQDFLRGTLKWEGAWSASSTYSELRRKTACPMFFENFENCFPLNKRANRPSPVSLRPTYAEKFALSGQLQCEAAFLSALESLIHPEVLAGARQVELAMSEGCFKDVYALNAFLVCAIDHYFSARPLKNSPIKISLRGHINEIRSNCAEHSCERVAEKCYGHPHKVLFECGTSEIYHIILLRHGTRDVFEGMAG